MGTFNWADQGNDLSAPVLGFLDLEPCPFCGKSLEKQGGHHITWYAHDPKTDLCIAKKIIILGAIDAERWNTRNA